MTFDLAASYSPEHALAGYRNLSEAHLHPGFMLPKGPYMPDPVNLLYFKYGAIDLGEHSNRGPFTHATVCNFSADKDKKADREKDIISEVHAAAALRGIPVITVEEHDFSDEEGAVSCEIQRREELLKKQCKLDLWHQQKGSMLEPPLIVVFPDYRTKHLWRRDMILRNIFVGRSLGIHNVVVAGDTYAMKQVNELWSRI